MDKADTLRVMAVLKAAYPGYYRGMAKDEADAVVELWRQMFADDGYLSVMLAVKAHIASDFRGFPPVIGAVKEKLRRLSAPAELSELEAWGLVERAVRNGIYGAAAEYARLPPMLQRLVGGPHQLTEWALLPSDELHTVVASNFQRSFRARAASEREYQALPEDVKSAMKTIAGRFVMEREEISE